MTDYFDATATFVWGGDLNECVSAFCSAAVLTQFSGGLMFDPHRKVNHSTDGTHFFRLAT
jgi:hypothetical protein